MARTRGRLASRAHAIARRHDTVAGLARLPAPVDRAGRVVPRQHHHHRRPPLPGVPRDRFVTRGRAARRRADRAAAHLLAVRWRDRRPRRQAAVVARGQHRGARLLGRIGRERRAPPSADLVDVRARRADQRDLGRDLSGHPLAAPDAARREAPSGRVRAPGDIRIVRDDGRARGRWSADRRVRAHYRVLRRRRDILRRARTVHVDRAVAAGRHRGSQPRRVGARGSALPARALGGDERLRYRPVGHGVRHAPRAPARTRGQVGGGPKLYGLLLASTAAGSFVASVSSGWTSRIHRQGRAVLWAVAGVGRGDRHRGPDACDDPRARDARGSGRRRHDLRRVSRRPSPRA